MWPWKDKLDLKRIMVNFETQNFELVLNDDKMANIVAGKFHRARLPKGCIYQRKQEKQDKETVVRELLIFSPKIASCDEERCSVATVIRAFDEAIKNN